MTDYIESHPTPTMDSSIDTSDKKIVYTTDFLRKFSNDGNSNSNMMGSFSSSSAAQHFPPTSMNHIGMPFYEDSKDKISDCVNLIQKLRRIIIASDNDILVNQMKNAFSDSIYAKSLIPDVPPLPIGHGDPFVHGGKPSISPRKENIQNPLITPASIQQQIPAQPTPAQHKSPRKLNTSASGSLPPILPNVAPSNISNITSSSNTASSSHTPNNISFSTNLSNMSGGSKIKRSPSMPTIKNQQQQQQQQQQQLQQQQNQQGGHHHSNNNSNSNNDNPRPNNILGKPPLSKSSSNTNIASLNNNKRDGESNSPPRKQGMESGGVNQLPRKPMTKSVSMGSIVSDNSLPIKCTSLDEIAGQIYHLTKYQAGCRFLQKKLEENPDSEHVTLIFNEVFDHLQVIIIDPYGQYLIPQLMKYCDKNQRKMIVDQIAPKVEMYACHVYGIHGIQKVLQYLEPDQVESIVNSIRTKVISLSKDSKGNYLIQSFLKQFTPNINQFIFDAVMDNVVDICTHKVGCTVVNRCIDNSSPQQLEQLVNRITGHSLQLVQDQFGNYVVQHLLSNNKAYSSKLIKSLSGHIADLSVQKFSSNVIEKCLQVADLETYDLIIDEITSADILSLLQDKYANFVIQTALDVADENQHAKLVKLIVPYIHQIKTPYVIHIQKKILQV